MMLDLDTALLRAFVTVADEHSFTRAAVRLHRTQAAVSMQIRRLEQALGARLFDDRKKVELSAKGETLIGYARRILALNDEAAGMIREAGLTGRVTLGTPDDYATSFLPPILARFARSHPLVSVDVCCEPSIDLVKAVDEGRVDLALMTRLPDVAGGATVRHEPLVWAVGGDESVLEREPLPLALFPVGCLFRDLLTRHFAAEGRSWRVAYTSPSLAAIAAAVSAGLAATVLAASTVPDGLRVVGPEHGLPALPPIEIAVYHRPGEPAEATRRLRDYIVQTLANEQPVGVQLA